MQVKHTPANSCTRKFFDDRRLMSKRKCLLCVLASDELFGAGIPEFGSTRPAAFYAYILKFRKLPPEGMKAKDMAAAVADNDIEGLGHMTAIARPAPTPMVVDDDEIAGDDIAGDECPGVAPPDPDQDNDYDDDEEDGDPPAMPLPQERERPQPPPEDVEGPRPFVEVQHREADASYPTEIDGVPVQFEPGREDVAYSYHNRLRVSCNNPAHSKPCRKSRSMALQSDKLGPNAAHIFLGCWLAASDLPEIRHRAYRPNMDCQLAYKAQRGL